MDEIKLKIKPFKRLKKENGVNISYNTDIRRLFVVLKILGSFHD